MPCAAVHAGLLLFFLFKPLVHAASACAPDNVLDLPPPETPLRRDIGGGETHCYRLPQNHGKRLAIVVEQRGGADIRIDLPSGEVIDSPVHDAADELWFTAADSRVDILRLTSTAPRDAGGHYLLRAVRLDAGEVPLATRHGRAITALAQGDADRAALAAELLELSGEWRARQRLQWAAQAAYVGGVLWQFAGDAERAGRAYVRAGELYAAAGNDIGMGEVLNSRAKQAMDLAHFDEASRLLAEALELNRQHGHRPGIATTLNNQGLLHHYQGRLEEARARYLEAAALNEALERPRARLAQLNNLGGIHFVRGEAVAAAEMFREVIALGEQLGLAEPQAAGLGNLGLIQTGAGAYLDALATYTRLLEVYRGALIDPFGEARTLDRIGLVYAGLGDPVRAVEYLAQARDLRMQLDDRRALAQSLRHLAEEYRRQGKLDEAHAAARRGLDLEPSPRGVGKLEVVRGRIAMDQQEFAQANAAFRHAIRLAESIADPRSGATARIYAAEAAVRDGADIDAAALRELLPVLRTARARMSEVHLYYVLALNAFRQQRFSASLADLDSAKTIIESVRSGISVLELQAGYSGMLAHVLDLRIAVLMALHARAPDAGHARQALMASEAAKARALLKLLQGQDVAPGGRAATLVAERRALLQQISFRVSRQSEVKGDPQLAEWRARLDVIDAELADAAPVFGGLTESTPHDRLPELQRRLGPRKALLYFHVGERGSYAWVVTAENLFVREIAGMETVDARVQAARRTLERRSVPAIERNAALRALAAAVLDPVADVLSPYPELFIVADGALHLAPFAAMPDASGKPFVMRHTLRMLPSIGVGLEIVQRPPDSPLSVALVGDPVYDATDTRLARPGSTREARMTPAGRLRATGHELQAVAAALPDSAVHVFDGFQAHAGLVRDPALAHADIVHFAVHGVFDSEAPALSGLLLSRFDAEGNPRNGFIGLRDIYALDWDATLVVLSGCETALGRRLDGVGVIGMTSGFLAAGEAQTVASLWRIPDTATAEFMRHFYASLENLDAAAALRAAQLKMRADRRWRHPYFWSGFVAHGVAPSK